MINDSLKDFNRYLKKDIGPAVTELGKVVDEKSRKHLQKVVYTNMVDRFDFMVDSFLLENSMHKDLIEEASKKLDKPVIESELIKLLLNPKKEEMIKEKLQDTLRNTLLKNRHSKKLSKLFEIVGIKKCWNEPRVNISTGKIADKIKPQINTIPYSICGYADWLYSRRNAIVHGSGSSYLLKNDIAQLDKMFNCNTAKTFRVQLSAIKNTAEFYNCLIDIIEKKLKAPSISGHLE